MQNKFPFIILALLTALIMLGGCKNSKIDDENKNIEIPTEETLEIKGDSMLYGLSCDGTSDSVVIIWPFQGDPITYDIVNARRLHRIIGKPQIGDWIGIMVNPEDTTEATMVINLDQLKGTWTYPVLPVMKDLQNMSTRMQKRMMENMPDSVKEAFFIPREYGFTLKRSHRAEAVGRIMRSNTLEDDSPVQYPKVKNFKQWHTLNGKLLLVSGDFMKIPTNEDEKPEKPKNVIDTLEFVYLDQDSLILMSHGKRIGFHRKENAMKANAEASKAQKEQDEKKEKESIKK